MFATDAISARMNDQFISLPSTPRYESVKARSFAMSSVVRVESPAPVDVHQPMVVSLSWVPEYATRSRG